MNHETIIAELLNTPFGDIFFFALKLYGAFLLVRAIYTLPVWIVAELTGTKHPYARRIVLIDGKSDENGLKPDEYIKLFGGRNK